MKEVGADVDVEKVWSGSFSLPFFFQPSYLLCLSS